MCASKLLCRGGLVSPSPFDLSNIYFHTHPHLQMGQLRGKEKGWERGVDGLVPPRLSRPAPPVESMVLSFHWDSRAHWAYV